MVCCLVSLSVKRDSEPDAAVAGDGLLGFCSFQQSCASSGYQDWHAGLSQDHQGKAALYKGSTVCRRAHALKTPVVFAGCCHLPNVTSLCGLISLMQLTNSCILHALISADLSNKKQGICAVPERKSSNSAVYDVLCVSVFLLLIWS